MVFSHNHKLLIWNGALWSTFYGLTGYFLVAYAVSLNASNLMVGLLGAMPFLAQLLAEIPGAKMTEYFNRKTFVTAVATTARFWWILIIAAPFVLERPLLGVVIGYLFARIFAVLGDPSWTSLMADWIPKNIRGKVIGARKQAMALCGLVFSVLGGQYLNLFPEHSHLGFATMFSFGLLFGLANTMIILFMDEPKKKRHYSISLKKLFTFDGSFRLYAITIALFNFAVHFASPFFAVYMLRNLGMSYGLFALAGALAAIVKVLAFRPIGALADNVGDKPVAVLSTIGTAIVPFFFLFIHPSTLWLIIPAQILSGLVWAGTELSTLNMLFNYTQDKHRPLQVAEFRIITAIPPIIAPLLGGLVADKGALVLAGIPLVFAISALMRLLASSLFAQLPRERSKRDVTWKETILTAWDMTQHRGDQHQIHVPENR